VATLPISETLAEQIRAIAARENRTVEELLTALVARYYLPPGWDEVDAYLIATGIIAPPSPMPLEPPLMEEEDQALADRIGAGKPLSEIVIEERQESW
jgi:hypothetical protein